MNDYFINAKFVTENIIDVVLFTNMPKDNNISFSLLIDGEIVEILSPIKVTSLNSVNYFKFKTKENLKLGHQYNLIITNFGSIPVDISNATNFKNFDNDYYYDGDDLGANYKKEYTEFVLWAPLASSVAIKYIKNNSWQIKPMIRENKGIYRLKINGDLKNVCYLYVVTNNGLTFETLDPYGKGMSLNSEYSVVIDLLETRIDLKIDNLSLMKSYCEASIYETHVRDFTICKDSNIIHKGKFLGMCEKGRTTLKGHPVSLDLLKYLGISHLQLLPVMDYKTVDERNPDRLYNWGYDPLQYFCLEGSFASKPSDPLSRIKDFKQLIRAMHENNIRVNMDVVFNHVYECELSIFERIVPNYYFRKDKNGKLSNGSGCGNDLASEKPMVRKMIVDSCLYFVKEFGVDGFRFDLMGLMDLDTLNEIKEKIRLIRPDFMFYGEGWEMQTVLESDKKATIYNAFKCPDIAFFNDMYRDLSDGSLFMNNIGEMGYLLGNTSYIDGFKFVFLGSSIDYVYKKRFLSPSQSINYVECHDNYSLYDKIFLAKKEEEREILSRIQMINSAVAFSFGIPFFHMGQIIGQSKNEDHNSYKSGDKVNMLDFNLLDERFFMVKHFHDVMKLRKKALFMKECSPINIAKLIDFENLNDGGLLIHYNLANQNDMNSFIILINPTDKILLHKFDDFYKVILTAAGELKEEQTYTENIILGPRTLVALAKKER